MNWLKKNGGNLNLVLNYLITAVISSSSSGTTTSLISGTVARDSRMALSYWNRLNKQFKINIK